MIYRRLARIAGKHQRIVVAIWLVIVLVSVPFAIHQSDHLTLGGYSVPGSQSASTEASLKSEFSQISRTNLGVLLWPHSGATAAELNRGIESIHRALHGLSGVRLSSHDEQLALFVTNLRQPIFVPLEVSVGEERAQEIAVKLKDRLGIGRRSSNRLEVHLLGEGALWAGLQETSKQELTSAETIGFPILLVSLLTIFGSLSAALLPIVLGAVAVIVTGALIYFVSLAMQLPVFVTDTVSMIGIGVAVDYSLIILSRVRQELRNGHDLDQARQIALATSGRAVTFSGLTVIVALLGVWVIPVEALRSMGLGAIMVVAVAVGASVSLLPALIGVLGARRVGNARRLLIGAQRHTINWDRWTRIVISRPTLSIGISVGLLIMLAIPALSIHTGTGAIEQLPIKSETRVGLTEAARLGGPGSLEPINVVVHVNAAQKNRQLQKWVAKLRNAAMGLQSVSGLGQTYISHNGSDAAFTVTPTVDSESRAASDLVRNLRHSLSVPLRNTDASVAVGGTSASLLDEEREIATNMWKMILAVLVLAFVVLVVLLRSLLLPIKAILMNLLSVGAAYGVLVIVFQWGLFDSVFHYHSPGHVDTLIPPLILPVVFGLSMDYEVFLLTRIKERWSATGDSRRAVAEGLGASAGTISGAALILVCVFAVFVATGLPSVKELGVGTAVAIGLDATLIRLILVPATMEVLGEWNWWLPDWLDRLLSRSDAVEASVAVPEKTPA